jgi:hypothetical protein
MDISQIVAMARDCGCFKFTDEGRMVICSKCHKALEAWL